MKTNSVKFLKQGRLSSLSLFLITLVFFYGCKDDSAKQNGVTTTGTKNDVDTTKIYIPNELKTNNFWSESSKWAYSRSKQSNHFIVFWDKGYGTNVPNSSAVADEYKVDIDDLLEKAEGFYALNINELKFAETGVGKSNLDKYKMMIFILYQTEWLATGSGYDNVIGALWVSPSTCKPVGSVIAHEIGHCFQYQVFCDLGTSGFRYGFGGNGGNAFWEQTAQWQSYEAYPEEAFTNYDFNVYMNNYFRHICHEEQRYASYFIHYYWADKHGRDMIGRIWREAKEPEDPIQAYMRMTGITVDQLNEEIYDAATKFVTWDLDALRILGADYIGKHTFNYNKLDDGSYQVAYDHCPGTTGYNVIRLNVPAANTEVSAAFNGQVNSAGFNQVADASRAGWRYGYVALLKDGTRVYSNMNMGTSNTAKFTVPENCSKLWFVVSGAPNTYAPHPWDDNYSNDDQWPYSVKFSNTDIYGNITFNGTEVPQDKTLTYNVSFAASATAYAGGTVTLSDDDITELGKAFVLQPGEIKKAIGQSIKFYGVEQNGTLNATTTANGYGDWFDASNNICAWGTDARVYAELDATNFVFTVGQYPAHNKAGDQYTIREALVYEYETGKTVQATFVFNVTIQ